MIPIPQKAQKNAGRASARVRHNRRRRTRRRIGRRIRFGGRLAAFDVGLIIERVQPFGRRVFFDEFDKRFFLLPVVKFLFLAFHFFKKRERHRLIGAVFKFHLVRGAVAFALHDQEAISGVERHRSLAVLQHFLRDVFFGRKRAAWKFHLAVVRKHSAFGIASVTESGGKLTLTYGNFKCPLEQFEKDTFRIAEGFFEEQLVTFAVKEGKAESVKFQGQEFTRK